MPGMVSKLSGTTKNLTAGLMSDPQKIENIISMVRTVAPLTAPQTVSKVNTYLPFFEKISTLLGMYSFLNRAQTFRPIESLNVKSPADVMTALMKNGNMPVGKMLAQPLIANNMEKMMGTMAMNMLKNGGLNDILKNGGLNDMLKNGNINDMIASFAKNPGTNSSDGNNIDLNSLMETFMPIISGMSSDTSGNQDDIPDRSYSNKYENRPEKIELKNESYLPANESEEKVYEESKESAYNDKYEEYGKAANDRYDRNYKNDHFDNYENPANYNENKSGYSDKKEIQRPIRIKQRRRRYS